MKARPTAGKIGTCRTMVRGIEEFGFMEGSDVVFWVTDDWPGLDLDRHQLRVGREELKKLTTNFRGNGPSAISMHRLQLRKRARTSAGSACKSSSVRKSMVLNCRSSAGGPQIFAPMER